MLTKLIEPGCKVEMQLISRKLTAAEEKKVYISKVLTCCPKTEWKS